MGCVGNYGHFGQANFSAASPDLFQKKTWPIDLSNAPGGVFSIKIMVGERVEMRRLVVVR